MTDCVVITVQLLSRVPPFVTPMDYSSPGSSVLQCLPVCSNSCPFESVMLSNHLIFCLPLLLWPQSFPASGSFPMSWLFPSGGQSIGAPVLPRNIQCWFLLGLTDLICMQSKGLSRIFSSTTIWKHQLFGTYSLYGINFTSVMSNGKAVALTILTFAGKVMSLLLNMLSRFVIAFLPRSKWKENESGSVSPSVRSDSFPRYGCIPPGSSVHGNGILQTRILEWVAIPTSKWL